MCGRTTMNLAPVDISEVSKKLFTQTEGYYASFNVGPTRLQPIITKDKVVLAKWGFTGSHFIINRRIESTNKPLYSLTNHCVVLCEAYFEWKEKQPYCIKSKSKVFYMAGLYGEYKGELVYVIITMPASENISPVHSRMPALLREDEIELWLNAKDYRMLESKNDGFEYFPVWKDMGKVAVDDIRNVQPIQLKKGFKQSVFDFKKKEKKSNTATIDINAINETLARVVDTLSKTADVKVTAVAETKVEPVADTLVKSEPSADFLKSTSFQTKSQPSTRVKDGLKKAESKKRKADGDKGAPKNRKITDFFKK
ncbi:hypothetical protein HDV06_000045 [Boothiomyces sp. JEL0866]|nr:hypothetical protein HDV06_000045 [Boothiomyces sp. JEL0866]